MNVLKKLKNALSFLWKGDRETLLSAWTVIGIVILGVVNLLMRIFLK